MVPAETRPGFLRSPDRASWILVSCFLAFAMVGNAILPGRYSNDTGTMMAGIEDATGLDTSFQRMSQTIDLLTYEGVLGLTILLGVLIIRRMARNLRTELSLALLVLTLVAVVPLNLIRPQKEFYVALLSVCSIGVIYRVRPSWQLPAISVLYLIYAVSLGRVYYYPILGMFWFIVFLHRCSPRARLVVLGAVLLAGFGIPDDMLAPLQTVRDTLNEVRILFPEEDSRTAFMNLSDVIGWPNFLMNYGYAVVRLNVPILFSIAPQEALLTAVALTWLALVRRGVLSKDRPAQLASSLILAHMSVLWLFEPDLGTYLRHLSSVFVYLLPLLQLVDARQEQRLHAAAASRALDPAIK